MDSAQSSSSSNVGEKTIQKQRKVSVTVADASFDRIVTDQFDQNMTLLADTLRNNQGLLTFHRGLVRLCGRVVPLQVAWQGGGPEYHSFVQPST